jgi:hypothetical protein
LQNAETADAEAHVVIGEVLGLLRVSTAFSASRVFRR